MCVLCLSPFLSLQMPWESWEVYSRTVLLVLEPWLHWRMCIFYEEEEKELCLSWREMSQQVQTSEVLLSGAAGFLRHSLPLQCQTSLGIITWPWKLCNYWSWRGGLCLWTYAFNSAKEFLAHLQGRASVCFLIETKVWNCICSTSLCTSVEWEAVQASSVFSVLQMFCCGCDSAWGGHSFLWRVKESGTL